MALTTTRITGDAQNAITLGIPNEIELRSEATAQVKDNVNHVRTQAPRQAGYIGWVFIRVAHQKIITFSST